MIQGSEDWFEFRRNHIQSSDAYKIFIGKEADLMDVWENKMGIGREVLENDAMRHGHRMEPIAREFFNKKLNDVFWPDVIESKDYPWMGTSLDGINLSRTAILEIKCPYTSDKLSCARSEIFDMRDVIQCQHHMICTRIDSCFYGIYESEENYFLYEFTRNDLANELLEKERLFWENHVKTKIPPIQQRDDQEWKGLELEYMGITEQEKEISREKERVLSRMKELAGDRTAYGPSLMLSKYQRKGNIEYGKIPELSSVNLENYRKEPTICWRVNKK